MIDISFLVMLRPPSILWLSFWSFSFSVVIPDISLRCLLSFLLCVVLPRSVQSVFSCWCL